MVQGLNFQVSSGEILALVGANGTGKTSTIQTILGILPFEGTITKGYSPRELGVVWQDRGLPLNLTVHQWISHLARIFEVGVDPALFERFDLNLDKSLIRSLSGGQQQKLAIISSVFHNPKFLVFDEPTAGLDEKSRMEFFALCSERVRDGIAILITSHNSIDISFANQRISLDDNNSSNRYLFTTDHPLSDHELASLQHEPATASINLTQNGYLITGDDPYVALSKFSVNHNFKIVSFMELS